ncbi:hemolysin III [Pyxidicoccus fallax]|uniref:Hemolysin III n=1 Tax=Pyxidicoccus fallax TaxID=394095 RepID=A0A848LN28_9BACT|nr:hemolysin III family protein [Pyxidicoccus fallax]NMO19062.1 hemolysin III [Pyxidicoccus fallax]NPC82121.1 hemolysin III [Pyxidicoccus fallax]
MATREAVNPYLIDESVKPRLRGLSHLLAAVAAIAGCIHLALAPVQGAPYLAAQVFGVSLVLMFGASGLYHVPTWSAAACRWLQRLDHAAIYLLIAGSFTPMAALETKSGWSGPLLGVMWGGALVGVTLTLLGISASRGLRSALYVVLGLVAAPVVLWLPDIIGPGRVAWLVTGGVLYALGAVVYARRWPDPLPTVFGYHEVFHLMVIAAASVHYGVLIDVLWATP